MTVAAGAEPPAPSPADGALSRTRVAAASPARKGPAVPPRPRTNRTVALTFDDGPSPDTPKILDVLRRNRVRATFCMLGNNAARYPALAKRVAREGHQVCNHTRDHANLARRPSRQVRGEITVAQAQIRGATGVTPKTFRFPYGSSDHRTRKIVKGYGLRAIGWDVDPEDWKRPKSRTITARVVGHVKPGSVVLMHDGGGDRRHTAASLDATIRDLRAKGYRFELP
jgi:peptidoglycan/xylan/chitin deacetylase (PgdA/CDA1 family)